MRHEGVAIEVRRDDVLREVFVRHFPPRASGEILGRREISNFVRLRSQPAHKRGQATYRTWELGPEPHTAHGTTTPSQTSRNGKPNAEPTPNLRQHPANCGVFGCDIRPAHVLGASIIVQKRKMIIHEF